jgi:hypothetical protein
MKRNFKIIIVLVLVYWFVANTVYRLRHPEKTETQLLLSVKDAMLWR